MLTGFAFGMQPLPGFRIQFDEPDVAEVRPVGEPERSVGRIAKHARIDRVAIFDAVGPDDRPAVLPLVVRRRWDRASFRSAGRSPPWAGYRAPRRTGSTGRLTRMTSGAQLLLPPRAMTSGPGRPPGTACITEPARRHVHPSSDTNAGSPLPVA